MKDESVIDYEVFIDIESFYKSPFDEKNPYELYTRGLICSDDLVLWIKNDNLELERKRNIKLNRKRVFGILFNN